MLTENKYKPAVFWSWNNVVEANEAARQVADFADKGIGGVFVHARNVRIPYMGEQWFACFDAVVESAKVHNIDVWIYDENGWPSGFGGGAVNGLGKDYCLKRLRKGTEGDEDILCRHGKEVYRMITEPNYVDLLNPRVTQAFLSAVHEKYRERYSHLFGTVIKGVFTDEPQLDNGGYPYSPYLDEFFLEKYGEPLRENLWKLFTESFEHAPFKARYFQCIGALLQQNFTRPVQDWCEKNGLLFTGHFPCEDGICMQPSVSGGVMPHYRIMSMPGIDYTGRRYASALLFKQLCSVKNIYHKQFVLTESYAGVGNGVQFRDLLRLYAYEASFGVNFLCMHLAAYSVAGAGKRDFPPAFSYQQPWWEHFGCFSREIAEINAFVSEGEACNDVLLFTPMQTASMCAMFGAEQADYSSNYRLTVEHLTDIGVGFDVFDDGFAADTRVENGKMIVNGRAYSVVVLPKCASVPRASYRLLREFSEKGTLIVVGAYPTMIDGEPHPFVLRCEGVTNRYESLLHLFRRIGYDFRAELLSDSGEGVRDVVLRLAETESGCNLFLFNKSECDAKRFRLRLKGKRSVFETYAGKNISVAAHIWRDHTLVDVDMQPGAYKMLKIAAGNPVLCKKNTREEIFYTPRGFSRPDCNYLVIDRVRYDGDGYAALHSVEEIRKIARSRGRTRIRYAFRTEITRGVFLLAETGGVSVNGKPVKAPVGTHIDRLIAKHDLNGYLKKGDNVIECECINPAITRSISDLFETVANSEAPAFDVENMILCGDFGVATQNPEEREAKGYYRVLAAPNEYPFRIVDTRDPAARRYFYRGGCACERNIRVGTGKTLLKLYGMTAPLAEISIDGKPVGYIFREPAVLDISAYRGNRLLKIELIGSNRNIFGPFHAYRPENLFVGRDTFDGAPGLYEYYDAEKEKRNLSDYTFRDCTLEGFSLIRSR